MAVPSFGGFAIFGRSVSIVNHDSERASQVTGYAGLNGLEYLDLGHRGSLATATGVLASGSDSPGDQALLESQFRSFKDGIPRALYGTAGEFIGYAVLQAFDPKGERRYGVGIGFFREYEARFLVLT